MKLREDLNPLRQSEPLDFHKQLSLWNEYEHVHQFMQIGFMIAALFAGAMLLGAIMISYDNTRARQKQAATEQRAAKAEARTLQLVDYLNRRTH